MSESWDLSVDVLVVGAGGCGLVAGLAAHEGGVEAVVVEKFSRVNGNTTLSTGSVPGAGTRFQREAGIEDSPERMIADLLAVSGPHDLPGLTTRMAHQSASLVEWLVDEMGVDLRIITDYKHVGHTVARLHAPPSRKGQHLSDDLVRALKQRDIPIAVGNTATSLITDDNGAVIGAVVETESNRVSRIRGAKIILATNGFGANAELVARFCPEIAGADYYGAHGSAGEAILWGEQLGAALANMSAYQGYAALAYPHGSLMTWTLIEKGGFIVNSGAKRFGNESAGYSGFTRDVRAQGGFCYAILDTRIRDYAAANEEEFRELLHLGGVKEAPDMARLAAIYGLDGKTLERTLEGYNRAAEGKAPDPFRRGDFAMAPLRPPFAICQVTPGLFHTQGGLMIDDDARVLDTGGRPIPNLFAGGGAAGGISGKSGAGGYASGNGLLTAMGLGRIAGKAAAREILAER